MAVGTNTSATGANDVALGASSVTGSRNALTSIQLMELKLVIMVNRAERLFWQWVMSTSGRQVQHVSAGLISADSTDAINGSQLYNVITVVNSTAITATATKTAADNAQTTADNTQTTATAAKVLQISVRLLQQLQALMQQLQ